MIPKDPVILLGYINTALRDRGISPAEFCAENDLDVSEITEKLASFGFEYDESTNQFR